MEHKKPYLKHCQHCIEEIVKVCSRGRNCVSKSVKRKKHFSSFTCTLILGNFLRKYLTTFFRFYFRRKFPLRNLTRFSMHLHIPLRFFCTAMQIVRQIFLNLLLVLLILFIPHYINSRQA